MERQDLRFKSEGVECAAWFYQPQNSSPHPCIVMGHGFGAIREAGLDAYARRFVEQGFAVFVFDYRHFGASAGEPRQYLHIGKQLADWEAAISYVKALDEVDAQQVVLWGTSFSGGHVLTLGSRHADLAAIISQIPFTSGVATAMQTGPVQSAKLLLTATRDMFRAVTGRNPYRIPIVAQPGEIGAMTTSNAEEGYRALLDPQVDFQDHVAARILLTLPLYRPGRVTSSIRCPVLYCVADEDQITPPQPTLKAAERTPKATVKRYPIDHFDIYHGQWFEQSIQDQIAFLREVIHT